MASPYKEIVIKPLLGILDNRSSIDEVPHGSFRYKLNASVSPDGRLGRALGWLRFYKGVCPTNHDWHTNQGAAIADREPPTLLFPSVENDGVRRLFMGTKTRLLVMDEAAGDWTLLPGSFGADGADSLTQLRFRAAELQNKVIFTNNFDVPKIHTLGSGTVADVPELADLDEPGPLTKARVVISFQGFIFLMNTEENGTRIASRIRWCDINNPEKWLPGGAGNVADYQDLPYDQRILSAIVLGGSLFVLTDSAIWRCGVSVDLDTATVSLNCVALYREPKNKARCLFFSNTLTTDGEALWYTGADAIYKFIPGQMTVPERVEWVHRATGLIFKDAATQIDDTACESPIAEFRPGTNSDDSAGAGELWISWPRYDVEAETEDDVDCETYVAAPPTPGSGLNRFVIVINTKYNTVDFRDFGLTALVNYRTDASAQGECNQKVILVGANSEDYTLKEMDSGFFREMYDAESDSYSEVGYDTVLRGVFPFDRPDAEKKIAAFLAEIVAIDATDPAVARLRLGTSDRVVELNGDNGKCGVLWHQLSDKPIRCSYTKTPAQYLAINVRPNPPTVAWNYLLRGRFLAYELTLTSADHSPLKTGGCFISRFEVSAALV